MSLHEEFVRLAIRSGVNRRELCRRFGISPDTGYRLLTRFQQGGVPGLADRSRRPKRSPRQTSPELEAAVLALRAQHPTWGGRKRAARLGGSDTPWSPRRPRSPRSSAATTCSTPTAPAAPVTSSASNTARPTHSGRWTSRATSPAAPAAATR